MKTKKIIAALFAALVLFSLASCASRPRVRVVELENKGTLQNIRTPAWVNDYIEHGVSRVQDRSEYRNRYVIIGEESGVNRQFVLAWADNFSAQQRIANMLRTTIASEYQARVQGMAQTSGGAGTASGEYRQEIDSIVNTIVAVSYSGAQRDADWWSLRRRYDPDERNVFSDEYTAYVLYTIPKAEMNRQVAYALETAVRADSALYDITIEMARQILQNGLANWGN